MVGGGAERTSLAIVPVISRILRPSRTLADVASNASDDVPATVASHALTGSQSEEEPDMASLPPSGCAVPRVGPKGLIARAFAATEWKALACFLHGG